MSLKNKKLVEFLKALIRKELKEMSAANRKEIPIESIEVEKLLKANK